MPENKFPSLLEHPVVAKLVQDPASMPDLVMLSGYIGRSTQDDCVRLYSTLTFDSYMDVKRESVLHSADSPSESADLRPTVLWVKAGTPVTSCRVVPASARRSPSSTAAFGDTVEVPDVEGSRAWAIHWLRGAGLNYRFNGGGDYVFHQSPAAGRFVAPGTVVWLDTKVWHD